MFSRFFLSDEAALVAAAEQWLAEVTRPVQVHLSGELGAGKSTFVRAALAALGYKGNVKSPTFSLLETYHFNDMLIHHMDLYRLNHPEELEYLGFRDLLVEADFLFIEWPEQAVGYLPEPDSLVRIEYEGSGRLLSIA